MNSYDLRAERGLSSFDRSHVLAVSYVWEIPFFQSNAVKVLRPVLAGWQLSGLSVFQSGLPASITVVGDIAGVSGGGAQRANVVGNGVLPRGERTFDRYFNTAAFALPAAGTFGNGGRNIIRRPGTNNWDVSVVKGFRITEHRRVQFRAEFYNIFNHLSYNNVQTQVGSRGFGAITGADPARVIQLALRFDF
jgi:hypothetical protein